MYQNRNWQINAVHRYITGLLRAESMIAPHVHVPVRHSDSHFTSKLPLQQFVTFVIYDQNFTRKNSWWIDFHTAFLWFAVVEVSLSWTFQPRCLQEKKCLLTQDEGRDNAVERVEGGGVRIFWKNSGCWCLHARTLSRVLFRNAAEPTFGHYSLKGGNFRCLPQKGVFWPWPKWWFCSISSEAIPKWSCLRSSAQHSDFAMSPPNPNLRSAFSNTHAHVESSLHTRRVYTALKTASVTSWAGQCQV